MTRLIKALPILCLLLVLGSCEKETQTFEPTETSTQMTADMAGVVIDEAGEPLAGVQAYYKGQIATTNESGLYQFQGVSIDSKHNTVSITKDGYFESARTFRSTKSQNIFHQTKLIRKEYDRSFDSGTGGTVDNQDGNATAPTVEIVFPANAIVVDGSQDQYDGDVQVAIHYIDATVDESDQVMPGDLSALLGDNILGKATTYGMAYVELQSPSGVRLQIKDGATAELKIEVPTELRNIAPDEVTSSYFDEGLGLWKEEGTAKLEGDSYISEVTHFSCWSYNSTSPSVVVTARVVDQSGLPVPGVHVQITEQGGWTGGYGLTDQDGIFTGAVAKDVVLNMYISNLANCNGQSSNLLTDQVGPFAIDTDMGDIQVDVSGMETITVNATFYNCAGEPVTNGIAYVARHYFMITDGTLNVTVPACDDNINILWAHDLDTDRVSARLPLVVGQVNNYEDTELCETEANYVEVIASSLGIEERTMVEIGAGGSTENKFIGALFKTNGTADDWHNMQLHFIDVANPTVFVVGTYELESGSIEVGAFPPVLTYEAGMGDGEIVIEQVGVDQLGDFITGYYKVDFVDVATGLEHEFKGKFKLNTF